MKYIFKQIDNISGSNAVTTIEFDADYLPDILEHFEMFIRGSGFHPSGTLDFVNESWADDCPQFEPAEEHYEEPVQEEWPFPLQKQPVMQESFYDDCESPSAGATTGWTSPWQGVVPSTVMQWTAEQLIKHPQMKEVCPICKIETETMKLQKCWDKNCPKGSLDAN